MAGAVAGGMISLGGMQVHGLALAGGALALSALAWLGANVLVGLAEELWFRAYFLQSLWKSVGFWPAAILIAAIFAALHYFFKEGENVWDVITLVSISMMLCWSVKRTGALWFAVGFHIAFDFMQFFVIGTPNGNLIPQGRMLNVDLQRPRMADRRRARHRSELADVSYDRAGLALCRDTIRAGPEGRVSWGRCNLRVSRLV